MNNKNILIATNLKLWSIRKGVGAPSFYNTLALYASRCKTVYFYTTEENIDTSEFENVQIIKIPKLKLFNLPYFFTINRIFNYILYQFILLFMLFKRNHKNIDFVYGYEIEFIPSLMLYSRITKKTFISRFQGTILHPLMSKSFWKLRYFPHYFSIKCKSNLTIMTDDGTKGDEVIQRIRTQTSPVLFLKNGVHFKNYNPENLTENVKLLAKSTAQFDFNFITVSRLESWKRVDRSIKVFKDFHLKQPHSRLLIVGDGDTRVPLEKLVNELNLQENVTFTGGVNSDEVQYLLESSQYFLSHYELSNVGNPLWEAMRANLLVVTLANGDTNKVIHDFENGIISKESEYLENANKLLTIINDPVKMDQILENAQITLKQTVCTWEQRMNTELTEVLKLK